LTLFLAIKLTYIFFSSHSIAGLPGGRIALFFAAFNMLLVISEQKVEPFELPDIDGGRSFTVVNNSVFVNRQLRQALLRKERYRNGVNLLQMRDSLSHKGILGTKLLRIKFFIGFLITLFSSILPSHWNGFLRGQYKYQ